MLPAVMCGCNKTDGPGAGRTPNPAAFPADSISVTCNGSLVESYSFKYDDEGRLISLERFDHIGGKALLDLVYSYEGSGMTASGTMDGKAGISTINVSHSSSKVSWDNGGANVWRYTTSMSNGVADKTESSVDFSSNAGYYQSSTSFRESYGREGKDIVAVESGTSVSSRAKKPIFGEGKNGLKPVHLSSSSTLTTTYKYSDIADRQNFNSFLFGCSFPVWYAEGLPGCEHLITDISMAAGTVELPQTQHIDYTTDSDDNILSAIRSWTSDGKLVLKLKYEFFYNRINK